MATSPEPFPVPPADPWGFVRRLAIATLGVMLFLMAIVILRAGQVILQPLFIAVFIGYLILPAHQWLVQHHVPGVLGYVVILALILGGLFGLGTMAYHHFEQLLERLPDYEKRADAIVHQVVESLPLDLPDKERLRLRDLAFVQNLGTSQQILAAIGTMRDFLTGAAIAFIYLVFLMAEKVTFPHRLALAFGEAQGQRVLAVAGTINRAITEYLAIKTFISFLAGVLSFIVLWSYGIDFSAMWAIAIFLFNYIPYLGSLVAVALPILLGFVQLEPWQALLMALLLIGIQLVLGNFLEPRLAGRRLGVSPLLILLALSFWGFLWGIVGMILAVPLLMVVKIVLDNIPETRPLGTLMSNL